MWRAEAAPAPILLSATASDASTGGAGVQAGDQVVVRFDSSTNAVAITAANIAAALPLNNGHSWLDGAGAIASAVWSTTTFANDTLTVTLSAGTATPTVAIADTVSTGTVIADVSSANPATGTAALAGSFGVDRLTVAGIDRAPASTTLGRRHATVANGVKVYDDLNDDGVLDTGEPALGSRRRPGWSQRRW